MVELWSPPLAPWSERQERLAAQALSLLQAGTARFSNAAIASSLQAEDAILVDLNARLTKPMAVFMIDTGRLDEHAHETLTALEMRYGLAIDVVRPEPQKVAAWTAANGENGFYDSVALRQACCALRKVEPLARALAGRDAWVTGQRREQAASRAGLAEEEFDAAHGIAKLNPLAAWTQADVWAYVRRHDVPVSALYARGYASIGCAPCTRAVRRDEDPRAGRWWWEQTDSKECGLHVSPLPRAEALTP